MSMKNPLTPAGIEPATFRIVAQHLNHYATASKFDIVHNKIQNTLKTVSNYVHIVPLRVARNGRNMWVQISILFHCILYNAVYCAEFIMGHSSEGTRANYILNFVEFRRSLILH